MDNQETKQDKKKTYTEAQKKATKKYRETNKSKVNEQRKKYYHDRVKNDPEFVEYKRQKAREYYQRKKQEKSPSPTTVSDVKEESKELPIDVIEQLVMKPEEIKEEIKEDKPKAKKQRKAKEPKPEPVPEPEPEPIPEPKPEPIPEPSQPPVKVEPIAVRKNRSKK